MTRLLIALFVLEQLAFAQKPPEISISPKERLKVFDKTWETVNKKFYDSKFNGVDWAALKMEYRPLAEAAADKIELDVVLDRMLSELHTSHTAVGSNIWFATGISYLRIGPQYVVRLAYTGSPAKAAGIERGWLVTGGNGDCNAYGRKVTNTFQDLQGQQHSTELPCEILHGSGDPETPVARKLDERTFYLRFNHFSKQTASWLTKQVAANRSATSLVIDLRGNGGGDFYALRNCLKLFFPEKTEIAKFRSRNGSEVALKGGGSGSNAFNGQVFVLTNGNSYSGAEIFAAVMQETRRGVIVGRTTGGEVLGADHFGLSNGFQLHIPLYDFQTPKGTRLEGRGVIPDEPVEFTVKDFQENKDPDLERVRELLTRSTRR
jgi:carboxyl-terminal processing protease